MSNKLREKSATEQKTIVAEAIRSIQERVVSVYVFLMVAVFPLFIVRKYYNVLREKFYFFFYATALCLILCALAALVGVFGGAYRKKKAPVTEKFTFWQKAKALVTDLWMHLTLTDRFIYGFILAAAISTAISEWPYQAFWGNMGRLQGLFYFLLAGVSYTLVSRFYHYKKWHLFVFLLVGCLVSLWGVTDYFAMDIFGFRADLNDVTGMLMFSSSIGNINTLTGILGLYLGAAAVVCIFSEKWFLAFPAMLILLAGLVAGLSDNAVLAVGAVYALIPFVAFEKRNGVVRYVFMAALLPLAMGLIGLATALTSAATAASYPWMVGVLVGLSVKNYKVLLILAGVFLAAGYLLKKLWQQEPEKELEGAKRVWGVVCAIGLSAVVVIFVMANTGHLPAALAGYSDILVFSDTWGTNRGYVWKNLFKFFAEFPLIKKLFGSGPETYLILMSKNLYYEMQERFNVIFDSPHSEPLQYLITTGILGFITYYGAVIAASVRGAKYGSAPRVFAYALIGATAASLVNISVPITTPLVFLSMAIAGNLKDSEENS